MMVLQFCVQEINVKKDPTLSSEIAREMRPPIIFDTTDERLMTDGRVREVRK